MFFSVVVCTYQRERETLRLLQCMATQNYRAFEVLVIDGSGPNSRVHESVGQHATESMNVTLVPSAKGLTRQRNVGLRMAKGDVLVFLDDDVIVPPSFLLKIREMLELPDSHAIGGLTAYDTQNYPATPNLRWRLRKWLRVVRTLEPGSAERLGQNVPISFAQPFHGLKNVAWLPGFCMVYRRDAIAGLAFDEELPTYGGEDRDFSMRVGERQQLVLCGDLHVQHICSSVNRVVGTKQVFETAFGLGRGFRKRAVSRTDVASVLGYAAREFLVEILAGLKHPSWTSMLAPFVRLQGLAAGWVSLQSVPPTKWSEIAEPRVFRGPGRDA